MSKDILPGSMPANLPENASPPADFQPVIEARRILHGITAGALGTLDRHTGHPVTTLVTVGLDDDASPVLLVSSLSAHTANLLQDGRASVLLSETGKGDPLAHPRLTVLGTMTQVKDETKHALLRERFLLRHPKSSLYVDFRDFSFWRMEMASGHLNGGFARAADLAGADLRVDWTGAGDLRHAASSAIAHMNSDHPDAVNLLAATTGAAGTHWRIVSIDPQGMDLMSGNLSCRLAFEETITTGDALHKKLVMLTKAARAGSH